MEIIKKLLVLKDYVADNIKPGPTKKVALDYIDEIIRDTVELYKSTKL